MTVPPKWVFKQIGPAMRRKKGIARSIHLQCAMLLLKMTRWAGLWKEGRYVSKN